MGHLFGKAGEEMGWPAWPLPPDEEKANRKAVLIRTAWKRNSINSPTLHDDHREALEDPRSGSPDDDPSLGSGRWRLDRLGSIGDISRFETPEKLSCYFAD